MSQKNVQFITFLTDENILSSKFSQDLTIISTLVQKFLFLNDKFTIKCRCESVSLDPKTKKQKQINQEIPNKLQHPHLYHWYIIMKQFAIRTLQLWEQKDDEINELIQQFLFQMGHFIQKQIRQKSHSHSKNINILPPNVNTPNNQHKRKISQNYNQNNSLRQNSNLDKQLKVPYQKRVPLNLITDINQMSSPRIQQQYIMEMQLFVVNPNSLQMLRERLTQEKIQIISFDLQDEINLRVIFRIERDQIEQIKDKIAKWSEVSNIRFRKEKKMSNKTEVKTEKYIYSPIKKLA